MKRKLIFIIMCLLGSLYGVSQEQNRPSSKPVDILSEQLDSLRSVINHRESSIKQEKKDKNRADSLSLLVSDYNHLANLWEEKYMSVYAKADKFDSLECLLSESDSVFGSELQDTTFIPASLKNHYQVIASIITVKKDIEKVKKDIDNKIISCKNLNQNPKDVLPELIRPELDSLRTKILKIKEIGYPTLSTLQIQYFDKIRDEYNSFKTYFTNE